METFLEFPVVTHATITDVLNAHGIRAWRRLEEPMSMSAYLRRDLTDGQRSDVEQYAPKPQVVILQQPKHPDPYVGFRMVFKHFAVTCTVLPHNEYGLLVLVVAEWKHGMEQIGLTLPAGVAHHGESPAALALREYTEETGLELNEVIPLSREDGIVISGRNNTQRYFPYLGIHKEPITRGHAKLDATEKLIAILIPLDEWLKMIFESSPKSWTIECSSVSTTFLALPKLRERGYTIPTPL